MEKQQSSTLSLDDYRLNEFFERLSTGTKCEPVAVMNDDPSLDHRPNISFFSSDEEREEAFRMIYLERKPVFILFDYSTEVQEVREANSYQLSQKDCFFGKIKIATQIFSEGKPVASYALVDDEAIEISEEKFDALIFKYERLSDILRRRHSDKLEKLDIKYSFLFEAEKTEIINKNVESEIKKAQEFFKQDFAQEKSEEIKEFFNYILSIVFERNGYPSNENTENIETITLETSQSISSIIKDKCFYWVGSNFSHDFYLGIDKDGNFYKGAYEYGIKPEDQEEIMNYKKALFESGDFSDDEIEEKLELIVSEKKSLIWNEVKLNLDEIYRAYLGNR
jgi:hypothetical protein